MKFDEIRSNNRDYYMAIQNPVRETLDILAEPAILKTENGPAQNIKVDLTHLGQPTKATFSVNGKKIVETDIQSGPNQIDVLVEPVSSPEIVDLIIRVRGKETISKKVQLKPVRNFEVYFLPHSHVDIGFTHRQQEVAELQWKNLDLAIDLAEKTADYPDGSQYKWNAEISWVLDGYLKQANPDRKEKFLNSVANGSIGIDALYGSVLTGIQTEEELFNNTLFANKLIDEYGFDIQSGMITDVPGYTWGFVPGLAQTGIKYLSVGPNHMPQLAHGGYQVGHTLEAWGDVPFYWLSPSGKEKILFWMSTHGYSWFHSWSMGNISWAGGTPIINFLDELEQQKYPYDIVQLRYNIGNDNGPPDPDMPDFFKEWNEKYEWPKFRIATTMEMMTEFEKRYKDQIPEADGDFTPYWEDGVSSSAEETAMNKNTADRLVQGETLWAMLDPENFPKSEFDEAWTNVVLFSEHTWGAFSSKTDPEGDLAKDLWKVKKGFALEAQRISNEMVSQATEFLVSSDKIQAIQIINTLSWDRTELVKIPTEWQKIGNRIVDDRGQKVPTQVLSSGELAFIAEAIPPFGSRKYLIKKGKANSTGEVLVSQTQIGNDKIDLMIDDQTGAIASITYEGIDNQFINTTDTVGFNTYWYSGLIKENLSRNHSPSITIKENGPLISAILIETSGNGANRISQEIEVVSGMDKISITNVVDKLKIIENENVRFSYPFSVPNGEVRIDIPWAILEPGKNQLEGANLNFFSVQRFLDVSNEDYGITIATPDAPVWEIGDMYGQFWMSDMKTRPWLKTYKPSQTLYSWVMNNAWFVNYKAHQEGEIKFRYTLQPHGKYSASKAKKLGLEQTTPLLVVPVSKSSISLDPSFTLEGSPDVIVTSFKPDKDKEAWLIRLFNSSDKPGEVTLNWGSIKPSGITFSSPLEEKGESASNSFSLVPWEILTIRAEIK